MEKQRQIKMLSIVALVLAISAMTLGFAAFSTTLSISSSATVTPSSEDFKIKMYGFKDNDSLNAFYSNYEMKDEYLSDTSVWATGNTSGHENGIIDNSTNTISGIKANFTAPGEFVYYHVIIRNEGKYAANINWSSFGGSANGYTLGKDTTESLVVEAVKSITLSTHTTDLSGVSYGTNVLNAGDSMILILNINYDSSGVRADGDFSVTFPNITVNYSTA